MSGPSPGPNAGPSAGQSHTIVAWSFVAAQAALLIAVVATPRGDDWTHARWLDGFAFGILALGMALGLWSALRLGRGLTPSPLPNGAVDLVTRGPYRWVRHPMYTAVMLIVAGVALRSGSVVVLAEALALVILFNVKARWEEHRLAEAFPGYRDHEAVTGRFLPGWGHHAGSRAAP